MRCVTFCPDNVIEYRRDMSDIYQRLVDHYGVDGRIIQKRSYYTI
jgi:hypothetical protein